MGQRGLPPWSGSSACLGAATVAVLGLGPQLREGVLSRVPWRASARGEVSARARRVMARWGGGTCLLP